MNPSDPRGGNREFLDLLDGGIFLICLLQDLEGETNMELSGGTSASGIPGNASVKMAWKTNMELSRIKDFLSSGDPGALLV